MIHEVNMKTTTELEMKVFNALDRPTTLELQTIVEFLHTGLGKYGDPPQHIAAAIDYACSAHQSQGGFVITVSVPLPDHPYNNPIVGAVVINQTGMGGYIPENILVYIAVDESMRGKGIGKQLMQKALKLAKGDVALHVEPDNPARKLYEHLGFTNKYLEMRFKGIAN